MKTVEEIYQEMAALFAERTGTAGAASGDLAVRLYTVAAQICGLYLQAEWTWKQCFPQTAVGEYLDYHAALRGVERKAAAAAEGVIRFSVPEAAQTPRTIPAGTVCMTAGLVRFATTQEATLAAGTSGVDAPAAALEPGTAGNVAANTILTMALAPTGISACTNPAPFSGGADAEGDESLRARVIETYRRLANGANAAYYQQTAMAFDEVAAANVLPRARGVGTVDVVIATPAGEPTQELLERVEERLQQAREIAVDVSVSGPELKPVNVSVCVRAEEGRDAAQVTQAVEGAIRAWFDGRLLGKAVLRAKLGSLIYGVDGVENYTLTAPMADVDGEQAVLPVLGTLTVTTLP